LRYKGPLLIRDPFKFGFSLTSKALEEKRSPPAQGPRNNWKSPAASVTARIAGLGITVAKTASDREGVCVGVQMGPPAGQDCRPPVMSGNNVGK